MARRRGRGRRPPRRPRRPGKPLSAREKALRALDRNPLYNPSAQLAGRHLAGAVDRLADMQVRPQLGALDRETRTAQTQGAALSKGAGDYYRQLAEREAGTIARTQALNARTRGQLAGIASETTGQIDKAQAGEAQRQTQDADVRGQGLDGGNSAAAALAAMRARAATNAGAFRSAGELQGANYEGLQEANRSARGLRGGEVQGQLANRLANKLGDIRGKRTEVESSRGDIATKLLLQMRQSGFENLATAKSLGLKEADLAADMQKAEADRRLADRRLRETERNNREGRRLMARGQDISVRGQDLSAQTQRRGQDLSAAGGGKRGGLTPAKRMENRTKFQSARARVRSDPNFRKIKANPRRYGAKTVDALTASGVPREIASAAVREAAGMEIPDLLRRQIRQKFGFTVRGRRRRGRRRGNRLAEVLPGLYG